MRCRTGSPTTLPQFRLAWPESLAGISARTPPTQWAWVQAEKRPIGPHLLLGLWGGFASQALSASAQEMMFGHQLAASTGPRGRDAAERAVHCAKRSTLAQRSLHAPPNALSTLPRPLAPQGSLMTPSSEKAATRQGLEGGLLHSPSNVLRHLQRGCPKPVGGVYSTLPPSNNLRSPFYG